MKLILTLSLVAIGIVLLYVRTSKTTAEQPRNPSRAESGNMFHALRNMALNQRDISPESYPDSVIGIITDLHMGQGIATVTSFITGDASIYFSSGGGIIGAGRHESVQKVVKQYIAYGQAYLAKARATQETPLPESRMVNFYFLTKGGIFVGQESMASLENGTSEWAPLFKEANKVLTQLRLVDQSRQ